MATIAQGQLAGQLAAGLTSLASFSAGLTAAAGSGAQVAILSISLSNGAAYKFTPPNPLTANDSAALLNAIISLAQGLNNEWTSQLTAI